MNAKVAKIAMNTASVIGLAFTVAMSIYFIHLGVFKDQTALEQLVSNRVILGPLIFILIQIIQVVVPIIPGGISNVAGVLLFGPVYGFIYNYLGNVIGSLILFFLGRTYGKPFVQTIVGEKNFNKYIGRLDNSRKWEIFFTIAIFSPIAPDDILVLMTSLTKMTRRKFTAIILLGKPLAIAAYSFILLYGGEFLTKLILK